MTDTITKRLHNISYAPNLYQDVPGEEATSPTSPTSPTSLGMVSKLGLRLPNLAPEVDAAPEAKEPAPLPAPAPAAATAAAVGFSVEGQGDQPSSNEPKKKKYAKEAWPGKKPVPSLLM